MSKTPSFTKQLKDLFLKNLAIGKSRYEAKQIMRLAGRNPREMGVSIHSYGTLRTEMKDAIKIFKDIKAIYGPATKYLGDVTPEMIEDVFQRYRQQGLSENTLVARVTALRRVELRTGFCYVSKTLQVHRVFSPRGAYTPDEAERIIKEVASRDALVGQIVRLQAAAGLRLREALKIRNDRILDRQAGVERPGIDRQQGVVFVEGKGGRQRQIELLDKAILSEIDATERYPLRNANKEQSQLRLVQKEVERACKRLGIKGHGTHGFRSMAARQFLEQRLAAGVDEGQAMQELALWLGHNRTDVLKHYLDEGTIG